MRNPIKAAIVAVTLLVGFAVPASAGQFEDGMAAHNRGDYASALRLWRPLAERGNAGAQNNVGFMYSNGEGVPRNFAIAMNWFRKAADQGNADAQNSLGLMYANGEGVPARL